jgi:hypothetical protein
MQENKTFLNEKFDTNHAPEVVNGLAKPIVSKTEKKQDRNSIFYESNKLSFMEIGSRIYDLQPFGAG